MSEYNGKRDLVRLPGAFSFERNLSGSEIDPTSELYMFDLGGRFYIRINTAKAPGTTSRKVKMSAYAGGEHGEDIVFLRGEILEDLIGQQKADSIREGEYPSTEVLEKIREFRDKRKGRAR